MREPHDWRLGNQEKYLPKGATWFWRAYTPGSERNDHDHCEFCTTKFMMDGIHETLDAGYSTEDLDRWICKTCFEDFADLFDWRTSIEPETANAYRRCVRAIQDHDATTLTRFIRKHPELNTWTGDSGDLLDFMLHMSPSLFEPAFAAGLSPDAGDRTSHQTLLQRAISNNNLDLAKLCLRYGANVERRNDAGEAALGYAVAWASLDMVRLLVESGADVNAVEGLANGFKTTALDATFGSKSFDRPDIRDYLLVHGAKRFRELPPSPTP